MPQIIENFYENNIFRFDSFACDCEEEIHHTVPGEPPTRIYKLLSRPEKPLLFSYVAKCGLAKIAKNGTSEESNILGSLIALPDKKESDLIQFFKRNGFLFPIGSTGYESIDAGVLYELIYRIKATVELMTAANEIRKDYRKILHLTLYLMLSEPIQIQLDSSQTIYETCRHSFRETLTKADSMQLSWERQQEEFNKDTYTVADTIVTPFFEFDINEYNDVVSGTSLSGAVSCTPLYKKVVQLYCSYNGNSMERKIIDFLFHLNHDIGQVKTFDMKNGLSFLSNADFSKLNDSMKASLLEIARFVLGEEINANLGNIHPEYNIQTMSPSWKIDSLLGALYFSIFYLKPDLELYRPCANPRCGRYFLVKTTSTRTMYCSQECRNRVMQDRYRKRKRESQGK
ncbi:MAG: CGNR zinc finger domain-containing protein [Clostridium sp.]|nr:CGNR zinc finger domain-containing protein [Clostridium sp.]MCM1534664.1 CGNR zinc finger domain-containing protein [Clostridium sp.]